MLGEKRRAASGIYRSAALSIISSLRRKNHQTSIFHQGGRLDLQLGDDHRQLLRGDRGAFALIAGNWRIALLRKPCIFMGVCAAFGTGAAEGAFLTERMPTLTLTVPVAALLLVLLFVARPLEAAEQR